MKKIRATLLSDSLFLMNLGVMDYSLYLTIEKVGTIFDEKRKEELERKKVNYNRKKRKIWLTKISVKRVRTRSTLEKIKMMTITAIVVMNSQILKAAIMI